MLFEPVPQGVFQHSVSCLYTQRKLKTITPIVWENAYRSYVAHIKDLQEFFLYLSEFIIRFDKCLSPVVGEYIKHPKYLLTTCILIAQQTTAFRYSCHISLLYQTLAHSAPLRLMSRINGLTFPYKTQLYFVYQTYTSWPFETTQIINSSLYFMNQVEPKLNWNSILFYITARFPTRKHSILIHFLSYEFCLFNKLYELGTSAGVELILRLLHTTNPTNIPTCLTLYETYPSLHEITGRPPTEAEIFPTYTYFITAQNFTTLPPVNLDFLIAPTLESILEADECTEPLPTSLLNILT